MSLSGGNLQYMYMHYITHTACMWVNKGGYWNIREVVEVQARGERVNSPHETYSVGRIGRNYQTLSPILVFSYAYLSIISSTRFNADSSWSFSHDFTITPLVIGNGPTLTCLSFRCCLYGPSKVTFSSQLPITAGWTAAFVKFCFSRGLPKPNEIFEFDTMPGFDPMIFWSQGLRLSKLKLWRFNFVKVLVFHWG